MGFLEITKIIGFLFGTVLQISILVLMAKRKGRQSKSTVFAFLTFSVLGWNFAIFLSLFWDHLYRGVNVLEKALAPMALLGFIMFHPLLVHTLISFMEAKYFKLSRWVKYPLLISIYSLTVFFAWPLSQILISSSADILHILDNFIAQFVLWDSLVLLVSWLIILKLYRSTKEEEERNFLNILSWIVTLVVSIYFLTFVFNVRAVVPFGNHLALVSEFLISLFPILLGYYLYRYNYLEYVFKRGLVYSLLGVIVIWTYTSVIRPMGANIEERFSINFRVLESLLVLALVFFFDLVKRRLQELANLFFFRQKHYFSKVFSDLSLTLSHGTYMHVEDLLYHVASTISEAMKIREVSFIFFHRTEDKWIQITESTLDIFPSEIQEIVEYLEIHRPHVLNVYDLWEQDTGVFSQMKNLRAFTIIPIYHESTLMGFLNIGKRRMRNHLLAEEEEMLTMLVNQLVTAIANTRLVREKLNLERKMYENEKLSSLGRLSASIAHEVKNPLSSIKAITQVMKEDFAADDSNQEGLSLIIDEIDRLSRVVNQLLHFARPHPFTLHKVDIQEVIVNVSMLLKHEANRNQVAIENKIDEKIEVVSDQDSLTEIFFNLINNSIQAMPYGGRVEIASRIEKSEGKASKLIISIADNGPGISAAERDKIFEPFYTTKQTGTGLGLSIVNKRLEKLKGSIFIGDNEPGALFEVTLPMAQVNAIEIPEVSAVEML